MSNRKKAEHTFPLMTLHSTLTKGVFNILLGTLGLLGAFYSHPLESYGDQTPSSPWMIGGMVDVSYPLNLNFPENHRFRGKATTPHTNEPTPNLGLARIRKSLLPTSNWGGELAIQGGLDTDALAGGSSIGGADILRHLSRANLVTRLPFGNDLTLTAGILGSYIGFESFYSKDNWNYTRSYSGDNAPYFTMGFSLHYPVTPSFDTQFLLITGYDYLSDVNSQPSYGLQAKWTLAPSLILTENLYAGPDQKETDLRFWRFFSDTYIVWNRDPFSTAMMFDIGTEEAADLRGTPQTFWLGSGLFFRWTPEESWALALRPEIYWDRNGRITGGQRFLRAVTATIDYTVPPLSTRLPLGESLVRFEYRFDESTGPAGGFFKDGNNSQGLPKLAGSQHIFFLAFIWSFESTL